MNMKTVFITGASSGIGRAASELFLKEGYRVIGTSRSKKEVPGVEMLTLDLSSNESIESAIEEGFKMAGEVDIFVQCAGSGTAGAFGDFSDEELTSEIDTLFTGASRVMKCAINHFRSQGHGRLIVVGSLAARIPLPYQNVYSACKAALYTLVSAVRQEVRQFGIEISVIEPGDTKTGYTAARRFTKKMTYGKDCENAIKHFEHDEINGVSAYTAAREIYRAAMAKHPRSRYAVCFKYKFLAFIFSLLPCRLREFAVKKLYFS